MAFRGLYKNKDARKLVTPFSGQNVNVLLEQLLSENPQLELAIIGNNSIPYNSRVNTNAGTQLFTEGNEEVFNMERANNVLALFYPNSVSNIKTYSQITGAGLDFPNVLLNPLNQDDVGITISFNFRNQVNSAEGGAAGEPEPKFTPSGSGKTKGFVIEILYMRRRL